MAGGRFPEVPKGSDDASASDRPAHRSETRAPGRSSRRRWLVAGLGVIASALVAGAAITGWRLYPWLRRPAASQADIDARWAKVEAWARVANGEERDDLDAIAGGASGFRPPRYDEHLPVLEADQLTEDQIAAIEALVEWKRKGAPYAEVRCGPSGVGRPALPLFRLGQLAVFSGQDESALPRIEATLQLAQRMRRRGTVLELAVGASLAKLVSQWTHDRRTTLPRAFARYRPEAPEIHASLAREAVCMVRMFESTGGKGLALDSPLLGASDRPRPPFGIVDISREISVYEDYQGRLLEQSYAVRSDWKQMADVYEHAEIGKPKSLFLEALSLNANVIRRTGMDIDEYRPLAK
jgi:hypothetical protein